MTSKYGVEFTKSAKREFDGLLKPVKEKVLSAVQMLAIDPFSGVLQIKELRGVESLFRLRLGEYRVVYEVIEKKLIIVVIRIGHRKDVYRFLGRR